MTPVVPIEFHTGKKAWRKHRKFAGLLGGPQAFRKYAPSWRPLFLDLAGKTPAELLETAGECLSALALVRADDAETEAFRAVLEQVLSSLEGLADRDRVRWHELVRFSLVWALYRRPRPEREQLITAAQASPTNVAHQKEVQAVSMTIAEALKAEGRLDDAREILQSLLEEKFGSVPEAVRQRIQAATDLTRLHAATWGVLHLDSLEDFQM